MVRDWMATGLRIRNRVSSLKCGRLGSLQMVGALLVMAGLLINVWGGRLLDSWRQRELTQP